VDQYAKRFVNYHSIAAQVMIRVVVHDFTNCFNNPSLLDLDSTCFDLCRLSKPTACVITSKANARFSLVPLSCVRIIDMRQVESFIVSSYHVPTSSDVSNTSREHLNFTFSRDSAEAMNASATTVAKSVAFSSTTVESDCVTDDFEVAAPLLCCRLAFAGALGFALREGDRGFELVRLFPGWDRWKLCYT